jgi:polyhydroxyalkanoate synthesis regulator phasin
MAKRAKTTKKTTARAKTSPRGAADVARGAWQQAETQVKRLLKKNRIDGKDAARVVADLKARFGKERKKAGQSLEAQLKAFQARVQKEGSAAGKRLGEVVQQALASLDIPSRREIANLTRTVGQLSRKIDALQRRRK